MLSSRIRHHRLPTSSDEMIELSNVNVSTEHHLLQDEEDETLYEEPFEAIPIRHRIHNCFSQHLISHSWKVLKFWIFIFIFSFTLSQVIVASFYYTCWTAKQELEMLNRFDIDSGQSELGPWPLKCAHSFLDSKRSKPLIEALSAGFCSIGVNLVVADNHLYLADVFNKTFSENYLLPLVNQVIKNQGPVYNRAVHLRVCQQFTIVIDSKVNDDGLSEFLSVLEELLFSYENAGVLSDSRFIFETFNTNGQPILPNGVFHPSPIRIVLKLSNISYNEQVLRLMNSKSTRKFSLEILEETVLSDLKILATQISFPWNFPWPTTDLDTIKRVLKSNVQYARKNRFSIKYLNTPEDPELWELLLRIGVDEIVSELLFPLSSFLVNRQGFS